MKPGDLVRITPKNNSLESLMYHGGELVVCYDSQVIDLHNHYGKYRAVRMINPDGTVVCYPIDKWNFEVIQ